MQHRIVLIIIACGVSVFLGALYGIFGSASPILGMVGLGILVLGLVELLVSLRGSSSFRPNLATVVLVVFGIALHVYEQTLGSAPFSLGWLLWALVPYALCLFASSVPATRIPSIVGTTVVLLFDLLVYYDVFVNPTSSTAGLAFIFAPIWSSLVFAPVATLAAWLIGRGAQNLWGRKP